MQHDLATSMTRVDHLNFNRTAKSAMTPAGSVQRYTKIQWFVIIFHKQTRTNSNYSEYPPFSDTATNPNHIVVIVIVFNVPMKYPHHVHQTSCSLKGYVYVYITAIYIYIYITVCIYITVYIYVHT